MQDTKEIYFKTKSNPKILSNYCLIIFVFHEISSYRNHEDQEPSDYK